MYVLKLAHTDFPYLATYSYVAICTYYQGYYIVLGECMALWGEPNRTALCLHLYAICR